MTDEKAIVPLDHPVTVSLIDKASGRVIRVSETTAELLNAHYTVLCISYNALAMSGGSRWWNPITGEHFPNGLSVRCEMINPSTNETVEVDPR